MYMCKIQKYGTLMYRPNTDLSSALTRALWQLRTIQEVPSETLSAPSSLPENPQAKCTNVVLDDLNLRAHSMVKTLSSTHTPPDLDNINIDKMIEKQIQRFGRQFVVDQVYFRETRYL